MEILSLEPLPESEAKAKSRGSPSTVRKLRDQHHRMAELLAFGLKPTEVARVMGRSAMSVGLFRESPAGGELIAQKRKDVFERDLDANSLCLELMAQTRQAALQLVLDQLVEATETGEVLPIKDLVKIVTEMSDRTGFGRTQTQINVNLGTGAELAKRRAKANAFIEAKAEPIDITPLVRRA